ncbi:unnamed protein product [Caenorhabditis angaria]|uniref:Nuclear receptor domain-containing protein n=1 Tax=Caenorhabditis angaria TaxID=860376 RepID=A0A9P1IWS4_9PELO|nr:unnamed protein product [Caenorhabditis angaria]
MKIFMKMLCPVCFGTASEPHFGALVCRACAAFFRRRVMSKRAARCTNNGNCEISDNRENFNCKFCRMEKCLRAGMRIEHMSKILLAVLFTLMLVTVDGYSRFGSNRVQKGGNDDVLNRYFNRLL